MVQDPQRIDLSLEPLDDYVVVQPTDDEAETKTGLIIPASAEAVCQTGIVTAVGAEPGGLDPGDKVLFPKDAGFEVRLHGTEVTRSPWRRRPRRRSAARPRSKSLPKAEVDPLRILHHPRNDRRRWGAAHQIRPHPKELRGEFCRLQGFLTAVEICFCRSRPCGKL